MRFVAIIMAVLLALSLTACTDDATNNPNNTQNPGTTNNGNTNNGTNNNDDDNNGLNSGSNNTNGNTNGNDDNTNGSNTNNGTNGTGTNDDHTNGTADPRRVMYNGNLYEVTDEVLDSDDVGVELFSITNIVTDTPAQDGDAIGLDEGTKVYRLKDDNEYDEIAVEINDVFYKAVKQS